MSTTTAPLRDLRTDERWLLVQRIISSPPFQKSNRLRELLQYIAQETLRGNAHELTEQHIGNTLFHKPSNYSPLEDSSVRVHVRQLRLKLHEYFNEEGRNEPVILEIPKGSYAPIFRAIHKETPITTTVDVQPIRSATWASNPRLPWIFCTLLALLCAALLLRVFVHRPQAQTVGNPSAALAWPFSQLFDARHQTIFVVADSNYGMSRILSRQSGSLNQYLRQEFLSRPEVRNTGTVDTSLSEYLSNSTLTSFADVADVISLFRMAGPYQSQVLVRYPRDLRMRDLDHNNYVFIGSPGSNPWVSLLQDKLNFRESEGVVGKSAKVFANTNPLPGELPRYEGLRWTGTLGEDYATIALLPNATHDGSVLALQGLQQEGTEAAGRFLADEENRRQLMKALHISDADAASHDIWFEALIRSRTVSGAPNSTTLIAVRRIP